MLPFRNILVPVNNRAKPEAAISKAIELGAGKETTIHLVYVNDTVFTKFLLRWLTSNSDVSEITAVQKLTLIQNAVREMDARCNVKTGIVDGKAGEDSLADYIATHEIDIVILCQNIENRFYLTLAGFNGTSIYKATRLVSCPVLVVTPSCINHHVRTILLHVGAAVAEKQAMLALSFARRYRAHIYLVTTLDNMDINKKNYSAAFYKTFKILTDFGHEPDYNILTGDDTRSTLLLHASSIRADMVLTNISREDSSANFFTKQSLQNNIPANTVQWLLTHSNN